MYAIFSNVPPPSVGCAPPPPARPQPSCKHARHDFFTGLQQPRSSSKVGLVTHILDTAFKARGGADSSSSSSCCSASEGPQQEGVVGSDKDGNGAAGDHASVAGNEDEGEPASKMHNKEEGRKRVERMMAYLACVEVRGARCPLCIIFAGLSSRTLLLLVPLPLAAGAITS
jgi:hypothetical protein